MKPQIFSHPVVKAGFFSWHWSTIIWETVLPKPRATFELEYLWRSVWFVYKLG